MAKITNTGVFIVEGSDDATDVTGSSQIWCKSDAPSSLYHTDDTGVKHRLGTTVGAEVTTGATTVVATGIPPGVTCVDVLFEGLSADATREWIVRIGPSGGVETSGYNSRSATNTSANMDVSTVGFIMTYSVADGDTRDGIVQLRLKDVTNNTWIYSGMTVDHTTPQLQYGAGAKSLAGVLERVQISDTTGGTDTFDAGSIALLYW